MKLPCGPLKNAGRAPQCQQGSCRSKRFHVSGAFTKALTPLPLFPPVPQHFLFCSIPGSPHSFKHRPCYLPSFSCLHLYLSLIHSIQSCDHSSTPPSLHSGEWCSRVQVALGVFCHLNHHRILLCAKLGSGGVERVRARLKVTYD